MPTGKQVLDNVQVIVNGVDLSDHAHSFQEVDTAAQVDVTAFGGNGYSQFIVGLRDATVTCDFFTDMAASSVFSTLQPLYASGSAFPFTFLLDSTTGVSATNQRGSMLARLYDFGPINGAVGAAASFTATFKNAGSGISWGTI
jgi:hypothetical protein